MTIKENWQTLTYSQPAGLNLASTQLHHASQYVAMFGNSLLPKAADDSQSSMLWIPELKALSSQEINMKRRVRMALIYESFELQLVNENLDTLGVFPMSGQTKTTALSFVRTQARTMGKRADDIQPLSQFELPEHDLDNGAPFMMTDPTHYQELARYRHNAFLVLQEVAKDYEYASDVATWPHHFDTGSVITAKFDDQSNAMKTVGIGLAPADKMVDEPYYYVNHWQKNGKINYDTLPSLAGGAKWITDGWKGAVLKTSDILKKKTAEEQCNLVENFLRTTIASSLQLLEADAVKA